MTRIVSLIVGTIGLSLFAFTYSGTVYTFWAVLYLTPYAAAALAAGFIGLAIAGRRS